VSAHQLRAWLDGREVVLTRTEFSLLVRLARDPRRVVSKAALLREVWGFRAEGRTRTVDSHAVRLRGKLVRAGGAPGAWVVNHWGVGYSLLPSVTAEAAAA
jgi:DNA-binding response OmpR family regulator